MIPIWQQIARNVVAFVLVFSGLPIISSLWRHMGEVWAIGAVHGVAALVLLLVFVVVWPLSVRFFWQELGQGADSDELR